MSVDNMKKELEDLQKAYRKVSIPQAVWVVWDEDGLHKAYAMKELALNDYLFIKSTNPKVKLDMVEVSDC